jgi:hypothetical protein
MDYGLTTKVSYGLHSPVYCNVLEYQDTRNEINTEKQI